MLFRSDGPAYRGWQLQPNGITIEEVLNRELTALLKEPISVIGASRTDSGVHARGNVAVFDTENRMPADKICFALNQRLPEDIRVQSSEEVPADWHPRKANCIKTYEYKAYFFAISAISVSSVDTITWSKSLLDNAASMEYARIGFPQKSLIFFFGIRLLPPLAVIIANLLIFLTSSFSCPMAALQARSFHTNCRIL